MAVKIAFLFPGQGSQYVGMGKQFYDEYPFAREAYEQASDILAWDLARLSGEGPERELTISGRTQPAILVHSHIACTLLRECGFSAALALGHSLGEYSALMAAGAIDFQTGVELVKQRGRFMHEAVPERGGAMAALLGINREVAEAICKDIKGVVEVANYNAPGQYVLSGEKDAVESAARLATDKGARKAVMLPVGAPFHCSLLSEAAERMSQVLDEADIADPSIPVYANVTAQPVQDGKQVRELLKRQIRSAVRWEDAVRAAGEEKPDVMVELGPGKVLSGLNKRILEGIPVHNVEDTQSLEKAVLALGELN